MTLANMKVGTKLIGAFIIVSLISAVVGGIGISNMSKIDVKAEDMYEHELLGLSYIKEANINLVYLGRARGNFLLATTQADREKQKKSREKYNAKVLELMAKAKPLFVSDRAKQLFADFDKVWGDYQKAGDKTYALGEAEKLQQRSEALSQAMAETRQHADTLDEYMSELTQQKEARAKEAADETTALYRNSRAIMIVLILGGLLLGIAIGYFISRMITRPLGQAVDTANKLAAGDLTSTVEVSGTDEVGQLLSAVHNMQENLRKIVGEIKDATDTINTASKEIASGNSDLSQRTEEQASSLEETASSMEELTSTVRQNTENAKQANQLAISASDVAGKGGAVVGQVVTTMDSINESSRKIVDIISVIDGIAFQTNILALNAAVEAARAGEQGRGFAVVAGEVRNLAQRSAAAAKEIKTLIGDSVEKVEGGSKLVAQAGQTMEEIVTSIKRVTDIMSEITAASVEQSQGIEQVNTAITQMDEVTQQNAALVEEAAAAAESLEEQAQNLLASVSTFKVDDSATQVVAARAPAAATAKTSAVRHAAAPARKALAAPKAAPSKSTAVAKPKAAKASDDGEWQEF